MGSELQASTSSKLHPRLDQQGREDLEVTVAEIPAKKPKLQTNLSSFISRPVSLPRQQKINNLILNIIVKDLQPFSIINDEGFRELMKELAPGYTIPSRPTFTYSFLTQKYNETVEKLQKMLNNAQFVALTADGWKSVANESYIGITAHFITDDWKLYSCLLECFPLEETHTSKNLSSEFRRVVEKWNLVNKCYSVTTDNAANMVAAVKLCGWIHVPCFAHTLNLIIQNNLKEIETIRNKVKDIVEYFRRSTQANAKLLGTQKQMECKPLTLKQDVTTRWNSTFFMFQRIIDVQDPLIATMGLLHNPVEPLTECDYETLKQLCNVLQPFHEITVEMSSEKAVTLSKVILIVRGLVSALKRIETCTTSCLAKKVVNLFLKSINSRFNDVEDKEIFAKSSFLDPRFKRKTFVYDNSCRKVKNQIQEEIVDLIQRDRQDDRSLLVSETKTTGASSISKANADIKDLIWQDFDKQVDKNIIASPNSIAITELQTYIEDVPLDRKQDPLQWWKTREVLYPRLSQLAKKYLCSTATSVPSERIFSKAGQLISDRRSRLKGKNVEKILFLHCNKELL